MNWKRRLLAAGVHLVLSGVIAAGVGIAGLGLMYPGVYSQIAGGNGLFLLICLVDVTLGPLLTGIVFSEGKARAELRRDIALIAVVQLAALGYGVYVLALARPVGLVFEVDRFRIVTQADVLMPELPKALPAYRSLPWNGPWLLGARMPGADEKLDAFDKAMQGYDIGQRPSFWLPYAELRWQALARAAPATALLKLAGTRAEDIERDLKRHGLTLETARFLPLQARQFGWVVWLGADGMPKLTRRYEGPA